MLYYTFPREIYVYDYTGKGKPVIYMSPHIDRSYVLEIVKVFGIVDEPIKVLM